MREWTLSELCIGKGSYGIGAPAVDYDENLPTYLRITDINDDGSLNTNGFKSVDDAESNKYTLKENDIVFARTGNSTGRSYFYNPSDGTFVYAGFLIKFSLDPTKVNPKILKYYTHSQPYYDWVKSFDTGATRGNINAQTYGDMTIELPERKVQDRIVSILSSLDAKIENNNKVNAKLEEIAQNLFKEWFVDFGPFKDGKFVDSELGPIPEGWRVGRIADIASANKRNVPKNWDFYNYLDTGNITSNRICSYQQFDNSDDLPSRAKRGITDCNIIFSTVRPDQRHFGLILSPIENMVVSTGFAVIEPNYSGYAYYIYSILSQDNTIDLLQSIAEQSTSTYPSIKAEDILNFQILIPEDSVLNQYAEISSSFYSKIEENHQENQRLSTLRDTLLPKLMSGEIEV